MNVKNPQFGLCSYLTVVTFMLVVGFIYFMTLSEEGGSRFLRNTDMCRLTTGICSEKCVVRRFRRCANVYLHKPR